MKFILYIITLLLLLSCQKELFEDHTQNPVYNFDAFWKELDRNYAYFDNSQINWDSVYKAYRPKVSENTTEAELKEIFNQMASLLNDAHTNIFTSTGITGNLQYFDKFKLNQLFDISAYFTSYYTVNKAFDYGILKSSNVGYVKIKTFDADISDFKAIDTIFENLATLPGLILDVRSNRGGLISNSEFTLKYLADSVREVCKYRIRSGPKHSDFSGWIKYKIYPQSTGYTVTQPVVIITNRFSYSATEWFVLSARAYPNVTVIGDTTGGGSAIPLVRELPNGWLLRTSNSQTILPEGNDYQSKGLVPDIPAWITKPDSLNNLDTVLEKALEFFNKK